MKYYTLEGTFVEGHPTGPALKAAIDAHHEYLKTYLDSGAILVSGPKAGGNGGIIIIKCDDNSDIHQFCKKDPFVKAGIQEYRITEFKKHDCQGIIQDWFE